MNLNSMRAIAIDYWDKRCGLALEVEMIAVPKEIVLRKEIIITLEKYFLEYYDINTIIVWLPYDLYWNDDVQLNKTKEFIRELENKYWKNSKRKDKLEIIWIDERFTSFEADNTLKQFWKKNNIWLKDAISASIILETYLNNKKLWMI